MTSGEINFERVNSGAEVFFHRHLLPENILRAKDEMKRQLSALKTANERDAASPGEQGDFVLKRFPIDSNSKA